MPITEGDALARLAGGGFLSYDDVDDIFLAFGFVSAYDGRTIWYSHPDYDVGEFPANEKHEISVLSPQQVLIVRTMIRRLRDQRDLIEGM